MASDQPIIVVTGGNRGIGLEMVRQLAARGAQVVLTARKPEAGAEAVAKLASESLSVQFHPLDVTSEESVVALKQFVESSFGRLDVLINNAGIFLKQDGDGL